MTGIPIGALLYVNRSGSTLLSRIVSEGCADVFVFPEMGWIVDLLLAERAGRFISGDTLARLIEADPRRAALPVPSETLAAICAVADGVAVLLRAIARAACPRPPAAILIKHEAFAWIAPFMAEALGDVRFLHIVRDPRAVALSMRRTPVPEKPGFDMARGSLLYAARHWRGYMRRVRALAGSWRVTRIRYEDLAHDGDRAACARVADALGVAHGPVKGASASRYGVAPLDWSLHARIHRPFDTARTDNWRRDLTPRAISIIESICGDEMVEAGYAPAVVAASRPRMIAAYAVHLIATTRHVAGTARHYLRDADRIRALPSRLALALHKRHQFR